MLNSSEKDRPIGRLDWIGWGLWSIGMLFEVVADFQKSAFRRKSENRVICTNLILTVKKLGVFSFVLSLY